MAVVAIYVLGSGQLTCLFLLFSLVILGAMEKGLEVLKNLKLPFKHVFLFPKVTGHALLGCSYHCSIWGFFTKFKLTNYHELLTNK